jgi:hypothetical protein
VVAVLYGYFDDSGTDVGSPVAVMAGYVAHASDWKKFENKTKRLFDRHGIPFFRAKLFDHRQLQFKNWSAAQQLLFATKWCEYAKEHLMRGISVATIKADLKDVKAKHRKYPGLSAPANCMQIALGDRAQRFLLRLRRLGHFTLVAPRSGLGWLEQQLLGVPALRAIHIRQAIEADAATSPPRAKITET